MSGKALEETQMSSATTHQAHNGGTGDIYLFRKNHGFSPDVKSVYRLFTDIIPCITGVGCLYQIAATARDMRNYPPPGTMLDIDGCSMHCLTAGSGSPAVVLEAGLGGMSSAWAWIQPEIAKFS